MPDFIVADLSFISIKIVIESITNLVKPEESEGVLLVKPQFEVPKCQVGSKGVVRDPKLHVEVCDTISDWLTGLANWRVIGVEKSPITGPKGNIEFLIAAYRF